MAGVVFIDSSVLLRVLNVPGNTSKEEHELDVAQFSAYVAAGDQLVLPLTTVIETGNAIARVSGGDRHRCIVTFVTFLRGSVANQRPWIASGLASTSALLSRMLDDGTIHLVDLMDSGVGTGDAAIIAEVADLRERVPSATPIVIWTHDMGLKAYSG